MEDRSCGVKELRSRNCGVAEEELWRSGEVEKRRSGEKQRSRGVEECDKVQSVTESGV